MQRHQTQRLLKLGEEPGQLNLDTIFTQCQKYEKRMQNLRKPTHDFTVSAVASNSEKTGDCRTCAKETPWSRRRPNAKPFGYCLEQCNSECDISNISCNIKGCTTQQETTTPVPMGYSHLTARNIRPRLPTRGLRDQEPGPRQHQAPEGLANPQ